MNPEGFALSKQDLSLVVNIVVAAVVSMTHRLPHADIVDDARFLTHRHLMPEPKLEQGPLTIPEAQAPSLLIRRDTGGSKTVFSEALVKANPKFRFIALACRRTLANMLEARLGFENYQNIPGRIDCNRLAVQAESLFRLNSKVYCDEGTILIPDEVSLLIKQMCSDKTMGNMHNLNLQVSNYSSNGRLG